MRKVVKIITAIIFVLSLPITIYSNYWLYTNKSNPIAISVREGVDESQFTSVSSDSILVYNKNQDLEPIPSNSSMDAVETDEEIDYTGQGLNNISSPQDVASIRENSTEPLYLRGYLIVPSVGIRERIMEGLGEAALTYGVGTMNPSSHPSQYGTYALAGHNFGDWDYGTGLSKLQKYGNSLVGQNAYITYGDTVYEYQFVDVKQMFRDYSMPYTETDWNARNLSGIVPQYTKDYQVVPGNQPLRPNDFYAYRDFNPEAQYHYGKLLTLYTCHVMPPDFRFSLDRIVARAIQINQYDIQQAPDAIKRQIIAYDSTPTRRYAFLDPFITSVQAHSDQAFTATKLDDLVVGDNQPDTLSMPSESRIDRFVSRQLERNPRFMERAAIASTAVSTISLITFIFIPGGRRNE